MKIEFQPARLPKKGTLVLLVDGEQGVAGLARELDDVSDGQITRAVGSGPFAGRLGQQLSIASPQNTELGRVILMGIDHSSPLQRFELENLGHRISDQISRVKRGLISICTDGFEATDAGRAGAALIAMGMTLASYRFDKYKSVESEGGVDERKIVFCSTDPGGVSASYSALAGLAKGIGIAKDLVSEPPNVLTPPAFAERIAAGAPDGMDVSVLGEDELTERGMNAFLSVGQGSTLDSQLVVAKWLGAGKDMPISACFIGKGVTFDAGGLAIKPTNQMQSMKKDMAGAAAVWGAMVTLARQQAAVNVVGILGLAENMPSGAATRPGDVVTSLSGQTIEILDPDAEGRLIIADAITYAREEFNPGHIIDVATLTGSIIRALGAQYAGLFSNNDALAEKLLNAGQETNELLWRMPLGPGYDKLIRSEIADMKNIGGRDAGAITAAQFIQRFAGDTPWAHLDIAGMVWAEKEQGLGKSGPTGFGVRLLTQFASSQDT